MRTASRLSFPPFLLDPSEEQLWRDDKIVPLRRTPFALLRYLAEHPGRMVGQGELRKAVWGNVHVSEAILRVHIHAVRTALGDDASKPRLIETLPRRGYRFLPVVNRLVTTSSGENDAASIALDEHRSLLIGREPQLEQLMNWLAKASRGESQVVFVTGEAGIGKSSVVEAFLERAAAESAIWVGRGQCVMHQGQNEPYLPLVDAWEMLCASADGPSVVEVLRRQAPTWLAQMPAVISEIELERLQLKVGRFGPAQMLRELAHALESLGAGRTVVLVLEDLHWSDASTLAWLDFFVRRRSTARVMVIGTYRPVAALPADHPLRFLVGELTGKSYYQQLALRPLNADEVTDYIARRISITESDRPAVKEAGRVIHARTEGNPLFVVNILNAFFANLQAGSAAVSVASLRAMVDASSPMVPDTIEGPITQQFVVLGGQEQRLLEAASAAGVEFSAAAVAAAIGGAIVEVEERCAASAGPMSFLQQAGETEWPDGTVAGKFRFRHSLYREVIYSRVKPSRRTVLHRLIADRAEAAYGARVGEIAAELAHHFEEGRDTDRALRYRALAAQNAWKRTALRETREHLTAALAIASRLPDSAVRVQHELELNVALAAALQSAQGWGAPEVEQVYARVERLCEAAAPAPQLLAARMGIWAFAIGRGEWTRAHVLARQNLQLAGSIEAGSQLAAARRALGHCLFFLGRFQPARAELEQAIALAAKSRNRLDTFSYTRSTELVAGCLLAQTQELLGLSDEASATMNRALSFAEEQSNINDLTLVALFATSFYAIRREWRALETWARRTATLAGEHDLTWLSATGMYFRGYAIAALGQPRDGIASMRQAIATCKAMRGLGGMTTMLAGLAEAYSLASRNQEGLAALDEAFEIAKTNDEHAWEAELHRVRGELLLRRSSSSRGDARPERNERKAEQCFLAAREIARDQQAAKWELRATTSLCALWKRQGGRKKEACALLQETCARFARGVDTPDMEAARTLLSELSSR